ncbi:iron-containing alcohol dehydrogenase [Azospirillum brasilense]|uniref:iron-containing alcohol dehydrogenase n=1 Tax=Azospirillum brasilense TaxID=192 RepID=UPI001EDA22FF|nr:iron-containing alcohol dehydrogenase [Azospirillum brasilense]
MPSAFASIELVRPPRVLFGGGLIASVGAWARENGIARTLVVADAFNAARVGLLDLPGAVTVFDRVRPEPDTANLDDLLAVADAAEPQLVVGFGGGSAMDLAKLAAVLPGSGQTLADVAGAERVRAKRAALAQVPTTAGTGSEAGTRALVTGPATASKIAVQSLHISPTRWLPFKILTRPQGLPMIGGQFLMALRDKLKTDRALMVGFGRSAAKSSTFLLANLTAGAKAFLKLYPETAPRGSSEEEAVKAVLVAVSRRIKLYQPPYPGYKMGQINPDEFTIEMALNGMEAKDLSRFYTNDLIADINAFDAEAVKAQAMSYNGWPAGDGAAGG